MYKSQKLLKNKIHNDDLKVIGSSSYCRLGLVCSISSRGDGGGGGGGEDKEPHSPDHSTPLSEHSPVTPCIAPRLGDLRLPLH